MSDFHFPFLLCLYLTPHTFTYFSDLLQSYAFWGHPVTHVCKMQTVAIGYCMAPILCVLLFLEKVKTADCGMCCGLLWHGCRCFVLTSSTDATYLLVELAFSVVLSDGQYRLWLMLALLIVCG